MAQLQRCVLALALFLIAGVILGVSNARFPRVVPLADSASIDGGLVMIILGALFLVASLIVALTTFDKKPQSALLRLDWYLPTLQRKRLGESSSNSLLGQWLRRALPQRWQSNHMTKQRGPLRKWLRKLGLTWLASPVRRSTQVVCLLTFCWLFLIVCWPYDTRPVFPKAISSGWQFIQVDSRSGDFIFGHSEAPRAGEDWPRAQARFLVQENNGDVSTRQAFTLEVTAAYASELHAAPRVEESIPEILDLLFTGSAEFSLYEQDPNTWPAHYADNLKRKERLPAEIFLVIDPLVSLSTAVASRSWVWSLTCAAAILLACVLVPRGFCGYVCPLGTTIDVFDWLITARTRRFRVSSEGWWVHAKYYLLAGTMIAASLGVLVSGFFSAIPVLTRAMLFLVDPLQSGLLRGWHLVPGMNFGQVISILLFGGVLCLGFLQPRFWCKYVCPSGALFSLGNLFRISERKVESSCIHCNKCVEICPFDAIKPDFTTRTTDCTLCQTCAGVCPTHAIKFVERWNLYELKVANDPPNHETPLGRRGFLSLAAGTTAAVVGGVGIASTTGVFASNLSGSNRRLPVRPPGSVPEPDFLQMCIRCGECFKACPNNVLQPEGLERGLAGLWTPAVKADWAGCESSCNACGQVCPTGAIRALPLEEKRFARMGFALVHEETCLPYAGREACDLCVQECNAAGYEAIEYVQAHTEMDENGLPIEGTGFLAPVVREDRCVGCGLCQTRCYGINVKEKHMLARSAIVIEAGEGREDRIFRGSYRELHEQRVESSRAESAISTDDHFFIPDAEPSEAIRPEGKEQGEANPSTTVPPSTAADDPFGIGR